MTPTMLHYRLSIFLAVSSAVLAICGSVCAQEPVNATLIEQFGVFTCGEMLARTDAVVVALNNNPGSTALVLVPEISGRPIQSLAREGIFRARIDFNRIDQSRIRIVRVAGSEQLVMAWLVPTGANPPKFDAAEWNLRLSLKRPEMFYRSDDLYYCPDGPVDEQFSELLKANPDYRGKIVIFRKSRAAFVRERASLKRSITARRLSFFFVKRSYEGSEYWLVPPKRRSLK